MSNSGAHIDPATEPGHGVPGEGGAHEPDAPAAANEEIGKPLLTPQDICAQHHSDFVPPDPLDRAAVAVATLHLTPLNARRISPERGHCGWYIWGGASEVRAKSQEPDFFQFVHVAHLPRRVPQLMPFLALAPGWQVRLDGDGAHITPPHTVRAPTVHLPPPRAPSSRLQQWMLLSILLHVLLVLVLGDTTGGASRGNAKLYGPLNVSLRGGALAAAEPVPALRTETQLKSAPLPRTSAGAPDATPRPPREIAPLPASTAPAAVDVPAPADVFPPVIAREVQKPETGFVVPLPLPDAPPPPPVPVPALSPVETRAPPAAMAPLQPAPAPAPPPVAPPVPLPQLTREPLKSVEPPVRAVEPPPVERVTPLPVQPAATLSPVAPPKAEAKPAAEIAKPEPAKAPEVVAPKPVTPAPPTPPAAVAQPAVETPAVKPAPPAAITSEAAKPPAEKPAPPATSPTPAPSRDTTPSPARTLPDSDIFTGRGAPPTSRDGVLNPAPVPGQRLDLDSLKKRAGQLGRESDGRGFIPFPALPSEPVKTKEQAAFDKALARPDCKDAYADSGLAAVVPLVRDAITGKGCKWGGR